MGLTRRLGESEETEVFICASLCCTWPNQTRQKSFLFYKSALDQLRASSPHQTCFAQKEQREKEKKARKRRRERKSQEETTIWQHEKCRFQSAVGQHEPKYERQRSKCKVLSNRATLKGIWSNGIQEDKRRCCVILSVCSFIFNEWISALNVIILKMNPSNAPEGFKKGHQEKKYHWCFECCC